ncbi:MAG: phosphoribosylamine--glycine ligase [Chloroflexi bacterium]|nr:phosphoribosylamine--glycine ligase [Chloroflexota bacterium]
MKVLVIGKGGREHAIAWKLSQSSRISTLLCAPGNAGTARFALNVPISDSDVGSLLEFALHEEIDFTVVGPEAPLAEGIVDRFKEVELSIFGPTKAAARIESSKSYAKGLMRRAGVPTALAEIFRDFELACAYARSLAPPVVIKADGLAAGKGVVVAETTDRAIAALRAQMIDQAFGESGETVLIEEYLQGPELSVFAFVDGQRVSPMIAAVDYKRVGEGDTGPNTGGMGAYSPPLDVLWNDEVERSARHDIIEPVVAAMADEGCPFVGVLYAGLMLTSDGLKVIEFNCRFGDPEAQVVLPRIKTDLLELMLATVAGNVDEAPLLVSTDSCVGVVVASRGYPDAYKTGLPIAGLEKVEDDVTAFHAGTKLDANEETVTDGGRVLAISATGETRQDARGKAYAAAESISFEGSFYRSDIADFAVR